MALIPAAQQSQIIPSTASTTRSAEGSPEPSVEVRLFPLEEARAAAKTVAHAATAAALSKKRTLCDPCIPNTLFMTFLVYHALKHSRELGGIEEVAAIINRDKGNRRSLS